MRDRAIEPAALEHVVDFINGYAVPPRREAGEQDEAYPVLGPTLSRLAGRTSKSDLAAVANRLYPIFSASDKAATATLNSLLEEAHLAPRLAWDDEEGATTAWVAPPQASRLLASCVNSARRHLCGRSVRGRLRGQLAGRRQAVLLHDVPQPDEGRSASGAPAGEARGAASHGHPHLRRVSRPRIRRVGPPPLRPATELAAPPGRRPRRRGRTSPAACCR
jgi:hypothetical protein